MDDIIDGLPGKIKLLNINYKIIIFRNIILNNYLNELILKYILPVYHL